MKKYTIISIDDHDLFRSGMELIVKSSFPFAEFASFASLGQAVEKQSPAPDIVLLDLHLDGLGGHEAIPLLKLRWQACAIIIVTSELDHVVIDRARQAGADAVVSKSDPPERFVSAIRVFAHASGGAEKTAADVALSRRQREVLQYLQEGHSNKAIAKRLDISEFTVRGHVQQILKLLDVSSRAQAVFQAQNAGLI